MPRTCKVTPCLIEADPYVRKKLLIAGGCNSAVETAMGLARRVGNTVTLSYRQGAFTRIKERNAQHLEESPTGQTQAHLQFQAPGSYGRRGYYVRRERLVSGIPNDYVWVFAAGDSRRRGSV